MFNIQNLSRADDQMGLSFDTVVSDAKGITARTTDKEFPLITNTESGYRIVDEESLFTRCSRDMIDEFLSQDRTVDEMKDLGLSINKLMNNLQSQCFEKEIERNLNIAQLLETHNLEQLDRTGILEVINSGRLSADIKFLLSSEAAKKNPDAGGGKLAKLQELFANYSFDLNKGYRDTMAEILKMIPLLGKMLIEEPRKGQIQENLVVMTKSIKFNHIRKIVNNEIQGEVILKRILGSSEALSVDDIFAT